MIVVNPTTRQFNIPGADLVFGVTDDAGSEVKHFQCPRYVGNNLDIASSFVRINYRNANGEIDSHLISEITTDGNNVMFNWELHPNVTRYKGNITFVMCVVGPDTKVKWHTTLGRGQVLEGLEPDNSVIEAETEDVIAQLIAMVEAQTTAVEKTGADQVEVVKAAAKTAQNASVAEIEAKGVNTLDSIPSDYTALSATVDGLVRSRAGAIVCEAEGSVVAVKDASNNHVQGLRIFGRSTQNGIPTPDAPVEIKSVGSSKVTVTGKNLLPYPYAQTSKVESGITFVDNGDGSITASGTATTSMGFWFISRQDHTILPAGDYTLCPYDVPSGTHIDIAISEDELSWVGVASATNAPTTFTLSKNVYVSVRWYVSDKAVLSNATMRAMLCKAGVNLEYERPSAHQKLSIARSLPGIPVTSGGNYIDENGQQWICDEVDLERGVYVRRVFEETVSSEKITQVDNAYVSMGGSLSYFTQTHPHLVNDNLSLVMSDVCVGIPYTKRRQEVDLYRCYAPSTGQNILVLRYPEAAGEKTVAEAKSEFAGAKVVYALATPIETPLSETEIAAYHALRSNYPNTTVLNDAGAHMSVKYAADTKLYIDNKVAALVGNI